MEIITLQDAELAALVARLQSIAITPDNITALESVRADTNKKLKEAKEAIAQAKEDYLKPFAEIEQSALARLKPLEDAARKFASDLLETKKAAFRDKVQAEWRILSMMSEDGVIAPFEEIYNPAWYGMPEKEWKPLLASSIKRHASKDERITLYLKLRCTNAEAGEVEGMLIQNHIVYEKEIL